MNIDKASLSKSNKLQVTITLSGAELSWLHYLAAVELEKNETLGHGYGNDLKTVRELRELTDRIDPHYVEACVVAKRDNLKVTDDQMMKIVKELKQKQTQDGYIKS